MRSPFGTFHVIFAFAELTRPSSSLVLIAPFGASRVLVFALPASPLAEPRDVIGGHLVATVVGLIVSALAGAVAIVLAGIAHHRWVLGKAYPTR